MAEAAAPATSASARAGAANRLALTTVALAVAVPAIGRGGYTPASRSLFVALAGLALLSAIVCDDRASGRAARAPAVIALGALALVAALSAAWSIESDASLRWAALVAGYAALVVASATLALGPWGTRPLVWVIASLGVAVAAVGVVGVGLREEPFAEVIGGRWRAGGTLEYPPALALLELSALPALLVSMTNARGPVRAALTAAGAGIATAALALTAGRTGIALGCLILAAACVWPLRTVGARRPVVVAAGLLLVAVGGAAWLVEDRRSLDPGHGGEGVLALTGIVAVAALAWPGLHALARSRTDHRRRTPRRSARMSAAAVIGVVAAALVATVVISSAGSAAERLERGSHGRTMTWDAGLEAAQRRPLFGAGADAFYAASRDDQGPRAVRFAHNLPLEVLVELGVVGLLLVIYLYVAVARLVWRARHLRDAWLLGPAAAAFLVSNALDWTWHMAACGAVFCAALGGLIGARPRPDTSPRDRLHGLTPRG